MSYTEWIVEESGARLDKYLSEVSELSRTRSCKGKEDLCQWQG